MAQKAGMAQLVVIGSLPFPEPGQDTEQDPVEIRMDETAVRGGQHIVGAALFVKAQGQLPALGSVPEGKFHLVPVAEFPGTAGDSLEPVVRPARSVGLAGFRDGGIQQLPDLISLHGELCFIVHGLVHAAAAGGKQAADRGPSLQGRGFQHLQKATFQARSPLFVDDGTHLLAGDAVFDRDGAFLCPHKAFIGKGNLFYSSLKNITFFHIFIYPPVHKESPGTDSAEAPETVLSALTGIIPWQAPHHLRNNHRSHHQNRPRNPPGNPA